MTVTVDTAKLPLLLTALRLPTFARLWPEFCARANKEGWPAERVLAVAAIDRLVHHSTIFEMNVESYRRRTALAGATSISDNRDVAQNTDPQKKEVATPPSDTDT